MQAPANKMRTSNLGKKNEDKQNILSMNALGGTNESNQWKVDIPPIIPDLTNFTIGDNGGVKRRRKGARY